MIISYTAFFGYVAERGVTVKSSRDATVTAHPLVVSLLDRRENLRDLLSETLDEAWTCNSGCSDRHGHLLVGNQKNV